MSDVEIRIATAAVNTATGTQDFTVAAWGQTPIGSLILCGKGVTDKTFAPDGHWSIGATDGTNQRTASCGSDDGPTTSDDNQLGATDEVVQIMESDGSAVDGEANHSAFIGSGETLNWGLAPSAAWLLSAVFFAGTDMEVSVGTVTTDGIVNNTVNYDPGLSGEADFVVLFGNNLTFDDTINGVSHLSWGVATNESGGIVNRAMSIMGRTGVATSECASRTDNNRCFITLDNTSPYAVNRAAEVTSFSAGVGADEITFATRDASQAATIAVAAYKLNGAGFKLVDFQTGISTGNVDSPALGFNPQFVMMAIHQNSSYGTTSSGAGSGVGGAYVASGSEEFTVLRQEDDAKGGVKDANSISYSGVYAANDTAGDSKIGTITMGTGKFTVNFTTHDTVDLVWFALAVEQGTGAPGGEEGFFFGRQVY